MDVYFSERVAWMTDERFPARLRELREAAGLGQKELAEKIGMSTRQVSRLETGESIPSWPTVVALATESGVSCEAFNQPTEAEQPARAPGRPRKPATPPSAPSSAEQPAPVEASEPPAPSETPKPKRRRKKEG